MPDRTDGGLVVVGSGPAGLAAVRSFRERDPDSPVTMITEDPHPPYARPPLTKDFLQGASDLDELWLTDPGWLDEQQIRLLRATSVVSLDLRRRTVITGTGTAVPYGVVVLATGSEPVRLPVPGGDHPELIYVRDLTSGHRLRDLAERRPGRVAVLGSGFIGCEAAASLATRGLDVVLISDEEIPHSARLGADAGREVHRWLRDAGVDTVLGSPVSSITGTRQGFELELDGGRRLGVAAVVVGGGARPALALAEDAGLRIENGGVQVDASLRTADPHVFAVGDIACARNTAADRRLRVEHWGDAETHGEIAGAVAAGDSRTWDDPPGFWSTIGDRTLKYSAWGDGHDGWVFTGGPDRWSVWFRSGDELCGVLTHADDDAYELGQQLLGRRASFDEAVAGRTGSAGSTGRFG
ncbi:MAG TPA: FAD-dependent oxidoreductase [Microlunatus sp.]|nr:FAD-dependent oxidoreductase [Microlunatus sp.]